MQGSKCWIEISEGALQRNLAALRQVVSDGLAGATEPALLAVIKADAYGHGAAVCAPVLARCGAVWLGVTDACEGALVRRALGAAGIERSQQPEVLVMSGLERADVSALREHALTPVVWSPEQIGWLDAAVEAQSLALPVHVEIDTGMARQGARAGAELAAVLQALQGSKSCRLDGVMTHFASAEVAGSPQTESQQRRFEAALGQIRGAGLRPRWLHAGNTSTLDEARLLPWLQAQGAAVGAGLLFRSGLALFGYALPLEGGRGQLRPKLQPVGAWKTRVIGLRDLLAGETVGYNATYSAPRPMRVALLPVGYADGLRRELSGSDSRPGGWVMLRGERAPIVGRISMNLTTVDVSAIPGVGVGDEATLLGPGISAESQAALAETIPYEILCSMSGRPILVP